MFKSGKAVLAVVAVLALTGCEQLLVPAGDAPLRYRDAIFDAVDVTRDIQYGSAVGQDGETVTLLLDLYEPEGDTVTERPVIIFMHGGSFRFGNKTSPELVDQANHFAARGYVAASISYRLSDNGCSAAAPGAECVTSIAHALEDAQTAVRHVRDQADTYDVDTDRIAFAGTSAGAITAANVAFKTAEDPAAGVDAAVSLSGASILTTPNAGDAPLLLFHGTADVVVPYQWAVNTRDNGEGAGTRVVLNPWEGAGHVPYTQYREQILDRTRNFLHHHLDLANADR